MNWKQWIALALVLLAILCGPLAIRDNALGQSLYGLLTSALATAIGVWASWNYSRNSDKDRLTRYGLLAWRNVDALSVKVRQQIQIGPANPDVLESWLLDIDQAKWGWRDLLRELFELQERLEVEREEIVLKYKSKIDATENELERKRLESQSRLELAKINVRAPLPLSEQQAVDCPKCGKAVTVTLGSHIGSSAWPLCDGCGAVFPVHRKSDTEIAVNVDAVKLPVKKSCPHCNQVLVWRVPEIREVHFLYNCDSCHKPIQCHGNASTFSTSPSASAE